MQMYTWTQTYRGLNFHITVYISIPAVHTCSIPTLILNTCVIAVYQWNQIWYWTHLLLLCTNGTKFDVEHICYCFVPMEPTLMLNTFVIAVYQWNQIWCWTHLLSLCTKIHQRQSAVHIPNAKVRSIYLTLQHCSSS